MKPSQTLTPEEIRKHFPNASGSTLKANGDKEARPAPGAPTRAARRTIKAILTAEATPIPRKREIERKPGFTGKAMSQFVPVPVLSEANISTEHWRAKAARVKSQRQSVSYHLSHIAGRPKPSRIMLCRLSKRTLDTDNLASSFKHIRDEIASLLRFDDRDPAVTWVYGQAKDTRNGFTVDIEWTEADTQKTANELLVLNYQLRSLLSEGIDYVSKYGPIGYDPKFEKWINDARRMV